MIRYLLAALFAALLLSSCTGISPVPSPTETAIPPDVVLVRANPLPTTRGDFFTGSGVCASCHRDMFDEANQDVSSDRLWRATMMANAARDPYWQAALRAEGLENPAYLDFIEDKCATCHTPMARFTAMHGSPESKSKLVLDEGYSSPEHSLHSLGMDGVSCTLCHQIEPLGLGELESFSGEYYINPNLPEGSRLTYGPYQISPQEAERMRVSSGFIPVYGEHMGSSELCATCHTLFTPYLDAQGEIAGEFPEQMVYMEWLNSAYRESHSCQSCHMPEAEGGVRLSITGGEPRSPFFQHTFVGGNTILPRMFKAFGDELNVTASSDQFDTTIANAAAQIENRTAEVRILNAEVRGNLLVSEVEVRSLVGHKFPSGFPSRRAWLRYVVRDVDGQVIFESGAYNELGAITGNDHDLHPERYEPHYQLIDHSEQVQIYEAVMQNTDGMPTTILLRAAGYAKDNRLLPAGFDKTGANPDIAVYGEAVHDENFGNGADRIRYQAALGEAHGPFTIEVELLYQTIGFRWADNLRAYGAPETERFIRYYEEVKNIPLTVARAELKDIE